MELKKVICGFKFLIESNTWEKSIISLNYKAINSIFKLPMKGANVPTKDIYNEDLGRLFEGSKENHYVLDYGYVITKAFFHN